MPGGGGGVFLAVLPMLFEMLLHISCYGIWPEEDALNCIELMRLEEELAKLKKYIYLDSFSNFLFRKKILVSLKCLIVAIYSGPSVTTLMQVHFHRNIHGYIVLKRESCSYSSEFCYASFQVIPQY